MSTCFSTTYQHLDSVLTEYDCLKELLIEGISDHAFISRINEKGMEGAGIKEGDWLIFNPVAKPVNGDIVSLTVYGRPMCRRIFFITGPDGFPVRVRIHREDNITPDLLADTEDVIIRGVFSGLVRTGRKKKKDKTYQYLSIGQIKNHIQEKNTKETDNTFTPLLSSDRKTEKHPDSSMHIQDLGLPARITNLFMGIGMRKAQDILDIYDKESLLAIPGLGKATYETTLSTLEDRGFDVRHLRW